MVQTERSYIRYFIKHLEFDVSEDSTRTLDVLRRDNILNLNSFKMYPYTPNNRGVFYSRDCTAPTVEFTFCRAPSMEDISFLCDSSRDNSIIQNINAIHNIKSISFFGDYVLDNSYNFIKDCKNLSTLKLIDIDVQQFERNHLTVPLLLNELV